MEHDFANKSAPRSWKVGTSFSLANPIDLVAVKEAGLECIELTWQPLRLSDRDVRLACDEVVNKARELGIELWSLHIPFGTEWDPSSPDAAVRERVVSQVRAVLSSADAWNIRTAVIHPSWEPVPAEERSRRLEFARQTLGVLSREAAELGVKLAAECLPRTCLGRSADEMDYLLADNPELGVCCDVNHLFQEPPQQFIERLGGRIVTTHISDNDGTDEKHWMPGEGIIAWDEVIEALAKTGYRGPIVHEVRKPDPFRLAENWRKVLKS
ncbi:sugar phosphate isomerase/epimerase family protein [Paenibacillus sp. GYB003]|jgi:sugar phosphate isomerase/epimerase|uniref:sugar phosphate isomerase/epimerase family protein n=1 Tax=Paenibacillus sp. GYB003 TaxID=2994392 RepID=UPI002F96B2A9